MSHAQVEVTPRAAARARDGYPFVYRADVVGEPRDLEDVIVADERGRPFARALFAPPPAPIALRIYAIGPAGPPFDDILMERLARAIARRADAPLCRLVHAEADLIPGLFVDRYQDVAVVQTATRALDRREEAVARALMERLGVRLVVARDDGSARDHEGLPRRKGIVAGAGPTLVRVREGAATLELDVLADAKTGGFLDQRENHARAGELARGGEALDTFTYHGGFALALAPRAQSVLALDQDPRAVERARANARASGITNLRVEVGDAFVELRRLEREGRRFQVVVIDPPALAKRRAPLETALRAYKELNLRAFRLTAPDGWLVTCSCSGKVTPALFEGVVVEAARAAGRQAAIVERRGAASDHPVLLGVPETDYLKCLMIRVL